MTLQPPTWAELGYRGQLAFRIWCDKQWRRLPIVDSNSGNISITRVMALFYAALCWHAVENNHKIELNVLWLALAAMAAAFGKSTFSFLLDRMRYTGSAQQSDTSASIEIIDRRDPKQGLEHTP